MPECPDIVKKLVERFDQQSDTVLSASYNETKLRIDYINPLMKSLGWDVDNSKGYAEQYREVVHEDRVKVAGQTKAPDYSFRVGGQRKFFLEAKKPAVNVKKNKEPAYQLRRYAWSAKLACSILTDFEEFAIYDTRKRPKQFDTAAVARREYIHYTEYEERWDFIYGTFSREAVLKGDFDRYSGSKKGRGAEEFDEAFLAEIEEWRKKLASTLARLNEDLDESALNFAVQRIIDRIIFLRIAEDRGTEPKNQLRDIFEHSNYYRELVSLFNRADERYNSGLFHFKKEKDREEAPDTLTRSLKVDNKTLKSIIEDLYYPQSPYEFSVVSADILGSVYERFLGKVIELTPSHRAKIVEKPEVRKAGGVYYTPPYIVNYIVQNTVGELLKDKAVPKARRIKVLDPACGSGSFLIGAYQHLLDWYLEQHTSEDPEKKAGQRNAVIRPGPAGGWMLTISERKRILLDHIYGVDIDAQAVEVTKLNLLLKCLEGETSETLGFTGGALFHKNRALPDLGRNIQCGNSLIGTDIVATESWAEMDEKERAQINPFDPAHAFPEIFKGTNTGFDAVIGNPPYIFTRELMTTAERIYYDDNFESCWEKKNTFMLFMELAQRIINTNGISSFIVPNSWLTVESGKLLREQLRPNLSLVFDLNYPAFDSVSMEPCIFVSQSKETTHVLASRAKSQEEFAQTQWRKIKQTDWDSTGRITFSSTDGLDLTLEHVIANNSTIGEQFDVRTGLQAYESGKGTPKQTPQDVKDHIYDRDHKDSEHTHQYLQGRDVCRYSTSWSGSWMKYGPWLSQPRTIDLFSRPRIVIREITSQPPRCLSATFENNLYLSNKSVLTILDASDDQDRLFLLLGSLNSRLISAYYAGRAVKAARRIFPKIVIKNLREFPFPAQADCALSRRIINHVADMLSLHNRLAEEKNPNRREQLEREITATDRQIDNLVYELYGLTDDEISIVEDATA